MTRQMKSRADKIKFRKRCLCLDDEGVAGYFEDLPKLLFILFAVGLFVTSTITVYGAYNRFSEHTLMIDNLNTFSNEILNWDNLTLEQDGVLNGPAMEAMDINDWEYSFSPKVKYFEYQIMILDRSEYNVTFGLDRQDFGPISTEERPVGIDIFSKTIPVIVQDADGNCRASFMVVAIWR